MKKRVSILLLMVIVICSFALTACRQREGNLENVDEILMNDPELNTIFSRISVEISNGKLFDASLIFKDTTSEMIRDLSSEDACKLSKMVHDKIKAAVLDVGYTKIRWIEAIMYPSDFRELEDVYHLSFGVSVAYKTYVKVWIKAGIPSLEEEVSWGGFDELK